MPRPEPIVVLHVGAVPTASWVVQQSLLRNVDHLRQNCTRGLTDATPDSDIETGEILVADPIELNATLRDAFADPDVDVVVGSGEWLGPAFGGPAGSGVHAEADASILALAEATRPYRRAIVMSVCPQAQFLELHYERTLAAGSSTDIDQWVSSVGIDNLSWLPLHRKLTEAFGSKTVSVHDFRRTDQGHLAFLRDVFAAADLDLLHVTEDLTPQPELRLSETGVRLMQAANPYLASDTERADLNTFLKWKFSELDGPPGGLLSLMHTEALRERYNGEHRLLLAGASASPTGVGQ
jgi:hypothetical protein